MIAPRDSEAIALARWRDDDQVVPVRQPPQLRCRRMLDVDSANAPAHICARDALPAKIFPCTQRDFAAAKPRLRQQRRCCPETEP
eukprot:7378214-Prymnesium_polylepis.1